MLLEHKVLHSLHDELGASIHYSGKQPGGGGGGGLILTFIHSFIHHKELKHRILGAAAHQTLTPWA